MENKALEIEVNVLSQFVFLCKELLNDEEQKIVGEELKAYVKNNSCSNEIEPVSSDKSEEGGTITFNVVISLEKYLSKVVTDVILNSRISEKLKELDFINLCFTE